MSLQVVVTTDAKASIKHFLLLGRKILTTGESYTFPEDTHKMACAIATALLKTPYFKEGILFHSLNGHDCLTIETKPGIAWEQTLAGPPTVQTINGIASGQLLSKSEPKKLIDSTLERIQIAHQNHPVAIKLHTTQNPSIAPKVSVMRDFLAIKLPDIMREHEGNAVLHDYDESTRTAIIALTGRCGDRECAGNRTVTQNILSNEMMFEFPEEIETVEFIMK